MIRNTDLSPNQDIAPNPGGASHAGLRRDQRAVAYLHVVGDVH